MATYGALRTDLVSPEALFDKTEKVLVPGPTWPHNPRDVQLKEISYIDPESVRDLARKLKSFFDATTLSPKVTDDELNYQVVVYRDVGGTDTIFATNPDDPENPTAITLDAAATALTEWYQDGDLVASRSKVNVISGLTVTDDAVNEWVEITGDGNDGGGGGASLAFKTFAVATQSDVVADTADDTMTFEAGANIAITTNASTDTLAFAVTGINVFSTIAVSGQDNVVADSVSDTLTLVAGDNISITTNAGSDSITIAAGVLEYVAGNGIDISEPTISANIDTTRGLEFWADDPTDAIAVHLYNDSHLNFRGEEEETDPGAVEIRWHEMPGYTLGNKQTLTKDADAELPAYPEWVDSPQKVIWGLDPAGGHTLASSGTTLTLTLKVLKYTFDAVNFVDAVSQDIEIDYEGTECPEA